MRLTHTQPHSHKLNSIGSQECEHLPSPTHNLQSVCVDEDHGELNDFVDKVAWVILFTRSLKVHHADVVVIRFVGADRRRLLQLLLLIVVLKTLLQDIFHTSNKTTHRYTHTHTFKQGVIFLLQEIEHCVQQLQGNNQSQCGVMKQSYYK